MLRRNKGQVLVLLALALFVLLGFAALAVDVGYMYTVRNELQRSADSGALAGASAFFDGPSTDPAIQGVADTRARDYASTDDVATTPLDRAMEIGVRFDVGPDRIRVDTQRDVNLFFARILGRDNATITAYAVAEAAVVSQKLPCIKPWGIPFPWKDVDEDGFYDPGEEVGTGCPDGEPNQEGYYCQGTKVVLKIGTPQNKPDQPDVPSLQQEPGHFFALDFGSGAKDYKEAIKEGCPDDTTVSAGDYIPIEPGNMVGPTVDAVQFLIDLDPTSGWLGDPWHLPQNDPVYDPNGNSYLATDGSGTWMNSPRVVRIPVYDPAEALSTGKTDMHVMGFAGFWIDNVYRDGLQGTVVGRFIPLSAFGGEVGSETGPTTGPTLKILRLVE